MIALRVCVAVAVGVLLWLYPSSSGGTTWLMIPWLLYVATIIVYALLPSDLDSDRRVDPVFATIEIALLGTMFALYRGDEGLLFYPLFLLVVLLAALARRLTWALGLGVAVAVAHVIIATGRTGVDTGVLVLQVAILLTTAGIIGYLTEELTRNEETTELLDNALEISSLIAGAVDTETVYTHLTEVVARLFGAGRVAVMLTQPDGATAEVVAGLDQGRMVTNLKIDLERYPEITNALESRAPVVIDRAGRHPDLAAVHEILPRRARAASILVTPIVRGEEARGAIFVRLEEGRHDFTEHEIEFCRIMAEIAGQALFRAERFEEIAHAAQRDGLTGLYNVRMFQRFLEDEVTRAERGGSSCTLLMIDVDYLKHVNDTYGHQAGDQVLQRLAKVLMGQVRNIDTVARYGGEEFAVLLTDTSAERALGVAERLRERVESEKHPALNEVVTVSIGLATYPVDAVSPEELVEKADQALYQSKHEGRNRVMMFAQLAQETTEGKGVVQQIHAHDSSMIQMIRDSLQNMESSRQLMRHLDVIASLTTVMRAKDPEALDQLRDVSTLAELFVTQLPVPERQRWTIHVACLLRDIGLLAIGEGLLNKKGTLSKEEEQAVQQHPEIGAQIVEPLKGLEVVVPLIRHHHERWDGNGYPDGLSGGTIPYGARVVGLIDAFYAMVRYRPYSSQARGLRYACEEIAEHSGSQFDPELADRFLRVVDGNRDIITTLVGEETMAPEEAS